MAYKTPAELGRRFDVFAGELQDNQQEVGHARLYSLDEYSKMNLMSYLKSKIVRKPAFTVLVAGFLAFVLLSVWGVSHFGGMNINEKGQMSGCLFAGEVEVCTMSFANHLSQWQGMFTTTSPKADQFILLAFLLAALATIIAVSRRSQTIASEVSALSALSIKNNFDIPIFNSLKEAFSQGILNPKIYPVVL